MVVEGTGYNQSGTESELSKSSGLDEWLTIYLFIALDCPQPVVTAIDHALNHALDHMEVRIYVKSSESDSVNHYSDDGQPHMGLDLGATFWLGLLGIAVAITIVLLIVFYA